MKLSLLALLFALPLQSHAVETKMCPPKLGLQVAGFQITKSLRQVAQEASVYSDDRESLEALATTGKNIMAAKTIERDFILIEAKNGRCIYSIPRTPTQWTIEKIELYTTQGKNILYFQTHIGPKGILLRTYSNFELTPGQVTLTPGKVGIAVAIPRSNYDTYDAGGALVFVGNAQFIRSR